MKILKKILPVLLSALLFFSYSAQTVAKETEYLTDDELWAITTEVGELYDISPALLFSLVEAESSKNVYAENGSHKGLCQISTKWHKDRMESLGVEDVYDPYGNVLICADFLSELISIAEKKKYDRCIEYALMRYNMATDTANEMYKKGEISKYARKVVKRAEELEEEAALWLEKEEFKSALMELADVSNEKNTAGYSLPKGGIAHLYTVVLNTEE